MENFQDRGVWIRIRSLKNAWIRIRFVLRGWIRIRFVLRGWIRIRSISDRIRNPGSRNHVAAWTGCVFEKSLVDAPWSKRFAIRDEIMLRAWQTSRNTEWGNRSFIKMLIRYSILGLSFFCVTPVAWSARNFRSWSF